MGEWIVLLMIGLMLFGRNLPKVLKDAGKQIAELKRTFEKLKHQLHEDKEFRELSSAAQDLKDAVNAPRRLLAETVRSATSDLMNDVESVRNDLSGRIAAAGEASPEPAVSFQGLTDETRASVGPDTHFVAANQGKSPLVFEAEKFNGA